VSRLILAKRSSVDSNSLPAICPFGLPKRQKSEGARSGEYGGWSTSRSRRILKHDFVNFALRGAALSMWTTNFRPLFSRPSDDRYCAICGAMLSQKYRAVNFSPAGRASITGKPNGDQHFCR
jgi:hypothetical protein